jgi:AcrR family transcriptional regulator
MNTTHKKIFQSGKKCFERFGYKKTSVDDIVKKAGVAKGTFYLYFPSKEALYLVIIDTFLCEAQEKLKTLLQKPIQREEKLFLKFFMPLQYMDKNPILREILLKNPEYFSENISYQDLHEKNKEFLETILGNDIEHISKNFSLDDITTFNLMFLQSFAEKEHLSQAVFFQKAEKLARIIVSQLIS